MGSITDLSYLIAAVLFILGLKRLSSAKTARQGNLLSMSGMLVAVVVTLFDKEILDFTYIIVGLIIGAAIGGVAARKVAMTAMPQMVALFNGFGGIASTFVAFAEYLRLGGTDMRLDVMISLVLSLLIGTVTFSGSLIAFAKLQGIMRGAPVVFPLQNYLSALFLAGIAVLAVILFVNPSLVAIVLVIIALSAVLGVLSVIPIGGANMPIVIALLNSYSGLAAASTGFVLSNNVLIVSGALVGASGLILTQIMCHAMNRSLAEVLFTAIGKVDPNGAGVSDERKQVTQYTAEDAAMVLDSAQSMIIVPGYGLAVAQAQHVLSELAGLLMERGVKVRYAIHPVAGRMPGHMNVLLAEANVSYDLLVEMDEINDDFKDTDVALVIGANDVTNFQASCCKLESPLYGMPTLKVDQAHSAMVVKRSLSPGFAGVDNDLFYMDKTMMLFGDAKQMVTDLVREIKSL